MTELLKNEPIKTLSFLACQLDEQHQPIFIKAIDHIHQSVVGSFFLAVMQIPVLTPIQKAKKKTLLTTMASHQFLKRLFEKLEISGKRKPIRNGRRDFSNTISHWL
jgi:hypothetical protein